MANADFSHVTFQSSTGQKSADFSLGTAQSSIKQKSADFSLGTAQSSIEQKSADFSLGKPLCSSVSTDAELTTRGDGSVPQLDAGETLAPVDPSPDLKEVEINLRGACTGVFSALKTLDQKTKDLSAEVEHLRGENNRLCNENEQLKEKKAQVGQMQTGGESAAPQPHEILGRDEEIKRLKERISSLTLEKQQMKEEIGSLTQQLAEQSGSTRSNQRGANGPRMGAQGDGKGVVDVPQVVRETLTKTSFQNTARPRVAPERPRTKKVSKPEDYARFLAKQMSLGDQFNEFLRYMDLNRVDIQDLAHSHTNNPMEQRINGIIKALGSVQDREGSLLKALEKSGNRHLAELFCEEFEIDDAHIPTPPTAYQVPPETLLPENLDAFDTVVMPYLKDKQTIDHLNGALSNEPDFMQSDLEKFIGAIPSWTNEQKVTFRELVTDPYTLKTILNAWADVEKKRARSGNVGPGSVETLACALRAIPSYDSYACLRAHVCSGVLGPFLLRTENLRNIGYMKKRAVINALSLQDGWKYLAEHVEFGKEISLWETRPNPAELLIQNWETRNSNIGMLYDWSVLKKRLDVAEILESK